MLANCVLTQILTGNSALGNLLKVGVCSDCSINYLSQQFWNCEETAKAVIIIISMFG